MLSDKWNGGKTNTHERRRNVTKKKGVGGEWIKSLMRAVVSAGKENRVISTKCIKWWLLVATYCEITGGLFFFFFVFLSHIKAFCMCCSYILSFIIQVGLWCLQIGALTSTSSRGYFWMELPERFAWSYLVMTSLELKPPGVSGFVHLPTYWLMRIECHKWKEKMCKHWALFYFIFLWSLKSTETSVNKAMFSSSILSDLIPYFFL